MVTINQIKDSFVIDTSDSYVMPIGDLKDFWPGYSREERQAFRTTRKEHITMDAQKVLADIIGSATEDGYEEMDICCMDGIIDEQVAKLQSVLDDITSNPAWDVYIPDEEIDPDVEVTGDISAEENDDMEE